jgi:hypothetical protein
MYTNSTIYIPFAFALVLQTNGYDTMHFVTTARLLISFNKAKAATCEYKATL